MIKYTLDTCNNDKQFIFEFSINNELDKKKGTNEQRYISYKLFRKDYRQRQCLEWEGNLRSDEVNLFDLNFNDHINIKGVMKLFKSQGKDLIWMDVSYCYNLEQHFEGVTVEIPNKNEPLPPSPIPPSL